MRSEVTGTGFAVSGYEEDYLDLGDGKLWTGICGIAGKAGIESIGWSLATAFEYETLNDPVDERMHEEIREWRSVHGRKFPPVYRFKVTLEAEEIPEDEATAWWESRQLQPEDE